MNDELTLPAPLGLPVARKRGLAGRAGRMFRRYPLASISACIIGLMVIVAIIATVIAPYGPT